MPTPGPGQALTRTIYVSLDPYQWGYKKRGAEPPGTPCHARTVSQVVEARDAALDNLADRARVAGRSRRLRAAFLVAPLVGVEADVDGPGERLAGARRRHRSGSQPEGVGLWPRWTFC